MPTTKRKTTIEFYGAGGLEITPHLKKSLARYARNCVGFESEWNFIGTNLDKPEIKNQDEPIILSLPVFYRYEDSGFINNPFFSFEKIILSKPNQKFISASFQTCYEKANLVNCSIQKIPERHNGLSICPLNIQSGDIEYWNKKLKAIFLPENSDKFYIFYWSKHHDDIEEEKKLELPVNNIEFLKKTKDKYEIYDKVWGLSKFMRDYLKIRNRCYELEYNEIQNFTQEEIIGLIDLKIKKLDNLPTEEDLLKNSIKLFIDFGLRKNNFDSTDLALLHLYNRNNSFQTNYFESNFSEFVTKSTGSAHQILQQKDSLLLDPDEAKNLGGLESKLFFYDLFKNITDSCIYFKELKDEKDLVPDFIFLDDVVPKELNDQYIKKYLRLHDWFPNSDFYYSNNRRFLDELFSCKSVDKVTKFVFSENISFAEKEYAISKIHERKNPIFIGIDIDWNGETHGFKLLEQFRENVHLMKRPCFIFVFSRYEYPSTVRKAVSSGALFYITKQNYISLVPKVYSILRRLRSEEVIHPKYRTYENWHLLNKLEPAKVVQLKSEVIEGFAYEPNNDLDSEKQKHRWKWVQSLPKADLHCHIGSCLGPDLLPLTAIMVLSEKFNSPKSLIKENLKLIIDFTFLLAKDLFLNDKNKVELRNQDLIKSFGFHNKKYVCVFELLINKCKLTDNLIFPEVVLLNPKDTTIERIFPNIDYSISYFDNRTKLRKAKVEYDDLILFFILLIYIRENGIQKDNLQDSVEKSLSAIISPEHEKQIQNIKIDIAAFLKDISAEIDFNELSKNNSNSTNLLKHLQTSKGKSNSLFTYLRGCEYGGSAHLQTKASISLACYYIVHQYAIRDNIRYLTLRCAVDGYAKSGILTHDTAMQALLNGFDRAVKLTKKKIHVDLILTAKRHKSIREFEENVSLALQYRNGLNLPKGFNEEINGSFFDTKTKVVSFDLAGLEEGNRASKYLPQFMPLLKKCFPITIHAGEEDDHEAIWEAIYLVQSQRIGHGLTLRNNPDLIELVRDRHIAIELCPLSNILTRNAKGNFKPLPLEKRNGSPEKKGDVYPAYNCSKYYPLRQYLMQNLDVTINTDNPFVSGSTLTEEYLIAANLAGGLTKWEILRLVKNSFRSAAIPKEQKKLLMNEIDDEIYNLLFE